MTDIAARPQKRRRTEWVLIVGLPIIANLLLIAYLSTRIDPVAPPVVGSPGEPLPESAMATIVAAVEGTTGQGYECSDPWSAAEDILSWSCMTDSAVATLRGPDAEQIYLIEVTWFGFDDSRTELPDWTAAAMGPSSHAEAATSWVAEHVGSDAEMEFDGVTITLDGARGARSLQIETTASDESSY